MMRTYIMDEKQVFTCIVDFRGQTGSLQYDFRSGEFLGHRPENMSNIVWLVYLFEFVRICQKMVKPTRVNAEFN